MVGASHARGAERQLAGIFLCHRDEFRDVFGRKVLVHDKRVQRGGDHGDGREILARIIRQVAVEPRIDDVMRRGQ
jgi:hypothetical protein